MKFDLLKIETYGIKNLKDKITIEFSSNTISKKMSSYNIKAIFGLNGAGKSAIINSVKLYRNIVLFKDFVSLDQDSNVLKTINKKLNEFYFKVYFRVQINSISKYFSHEIIVRKNNGVLYIYKDCLKEIKGNTLNSDNLITIYEVDEGKLKCDLTKGINSFIYENTLNNLYQSSLTSILTSQQFVTNLRREIKIKDRNEDELLNGAYYLYQFLKDFSVFADFEDDLYEESLKIISSGILYDTMKINREENKFSISSSDDVILKNLYDDYVVEIKKLESFIKIFKPNLKSIDINRKVDGKYYKIQKDFNYGDYKINSDYESTGIKKILRLHTYINDAVKGKFVFIDELDTSLNGIYLDKLLEFLIENCKGVLCFTSHNLEPMSVLKSKTKSLLFLGETGKLVTWAKNGNYNPSNFYKEGMIEDSPFNIIKQDFYDCFDVEE